MSGRLLYIVSRREPELYEYLKRHFADENVEVVLDRRRAGDRAWGSGLLRAERRTRDVTADLRGIGWAIVGSDWPAAGDARPIGD